MLEGNLNIVIYPIYRYHMYLICL